MSFFIRPPACTNRGPNSYCIVTAKRNGTQLVGLTKDREAEVTLYRAGQVLTVTARCGNFSEDGLSLDDCVVKSVR